MVKKKPSDTGKGSMTSTKGNKEVRRKYRQEKYKNVMGNKAEGHGFAEKRKQKIMRQYRKMLHRQQGQLEANTVKTQSIYAEDKEKDSQKSKHAAKISTLHKAQLEFSKLKKEKERIHQEAAKKQKEREEALSKYADRKKKQQKKLVKKNFRGQPCLASRMELLLEKIQSGQS